MSDPIEDAKIAMIRAAEKHGMMKWDEMTRAAVAAYRDSEIEALERKLDETEAKLADCRAVIRHKGHDADCSVTQQCKACGMPKGWSPHLAVFDDYPAYHEFQPGPCSDALREIEELLK